MHDRQPRGEDRLKKILWILCFGMVVAGWQVSAAQAGMIQNLMSTLQMQSKPAAPRDDGANVPERLTQQPGGAKVDEIVIYKSKRVLELRGNGRILRHYRIALGRNPEGHKLYQGDNRTPEGRYRIDMRNANSQYYKSLRISYPDRTDADVALTVGVSPGDWIMIHGLKNGYTAKQIGHPYRDWTNGCIAVTNREMDEIWNNVDLGTPVTIWP